MSNVVEYKFTIAIIGAGIAAEPIISKAKEMQIRVIAFARQDSYAKNQVDIFIEENSFDIDFMKRQCLLHKVNGIIASSEMTTEVAAKLAHELKLPGNSITNGFAGKNKYVMRQRVAQLSSVAQPVFELYSSYNKYSFPVVVKAVDSCGKKGITLVYNVDQLEEAVAYAKDNSTDGKVLIEQYLEGGKEYSIECISHGTQHIVVQYTEKETSGPPHFIEVAHHQPALLDGNVKDRINIAVCEILDVLGLKCGMAHLEIKIINDVIYFIEVGARHGGDHIGDTLTINSTDFDYFRAAIECSLGVFKPRKINNVAYTGIYFRCAQNENLKHLFDKAHKERWCIKNEVLSFTFDDAKTNVELSNKGFFIYKSDHKITSKD